MSAFKTLAAGLVVPLSVLLAMPGAARAGDAGETPNYGLLTTIAVPGQPLSQFDISNIHRLAPLYFLADRSNAGLDIFDTLRDQYLIRIGGFVGVKTDATGKVNTDISGPNGVQPVGLTEVWVGDGDSSVKVVDLLTQKIVATISTGDPTTDKRADEMSYDPEDQILMVANNAAAPPFATLISTWPQDRKVLGRITFTGASGIEQSVYDRHTHMFYQNVVQTGSDPNVGGVAVIDPRNIKVLTTFPINGCQPAGLALGPDQNLLVGCALTNNSQVISAIDGTVRALFPQVSGEDEVWFNRGDGNYYLAARNNPAANGGPSLGIINARTNTFIANVPTDASAHSVAADWRTNQVFVPLGPNNTAPNCANGCIGVYGDTNEMGLADRLQDYLASVR